MTVETTRLPSGLTVVTDSMPHVDTAAIGVWAAAGSRHETAREHGLSHFLEHMAFKGTRRRSARAIAEEIEAIGGDINASTSVENTNYFTRVLKEDVGIALDILADILTDSVFAADEIRREKGVIIQEIAAISDTPDDEIFDIFTEAAWQGQAVGRRIIGTSERVASFSEQSLRDYLARCYGAPGIIVAAAGGVDHARLVEETQARFAALPQSVPPAFEPARYTGGETRRKKRFEQAHLVFGFEGVSTHDPMNYAAHVFTGVVGGGSSSRLFQEVREKRGLCYSIYSFLWPFEDTGVFGVYAGAGGGDVAELMPVAIDCLAEAAETLDEAEVGRAKAQMKMSLLTALESPNARAEQIARHWLAYGRVRSREEIVGRIDALTVADIRAAGRRLLSSAPTLAAVGPIGKALAPDRIAERLGR